MVINMYIVDRIEGNYVILECDGKLIEIKKDKLPNVLEKDVLYLEDGKYIKDEEKTEKIKKDIRNRFNRLKG